MAREKAIAMERRMMADVKAVAHLERQVGMPERANAVSILGR